jgi:hypothetical protein
MSILAVAEGLMEQSADEELCYTISVANWTSSTPSAATAVAYDETTGSTVTGTVFPDNEPTISTTTITLSPLKSLTKGHTYRIEVKFVVGSNTWECYFRVECTI